MFSGYDFVFDGKSSISENLKMLYTESSAFESVQGIPEKEYVTFKTTGSSKWNVVGIKHTEPLKLDIQIMFHGDGEEKYRKINPKLERNLISKITHWLFDKTGYRKLQILSDDLRDLYFMCVFESPEYLLDGGDIIGFKFTAVCDTTGAYEDKRISKSCNGSTRFSFQCLHDSIYEIFPVYEIKLNSDVTIDVNGKAIKLKSLTAGSTITIDTEKLIVTSSVGDNLYVGNRFNLAFPTFTYGKNTIIVTGDCELEIKYSLIREVGC